MFLTRAKLELMLLSRCYAAFKINVAWLNMTFPKYLPLGIVKHC